MGLHRTVGSGFPSHHQGTQEAAMLYAPEISCTVYAPDFVTNRSIRKHLNKNSLFEVKMGMTQNFQPYSPVDLPLKTINFALTSSRFDVPRARQYGGRGASALEVRSSRTAVLLLLPV